MRSSCEEMCVDEHGRQHEYSVPPPLIRKDLIAQHARTRRTAIMPPPFLDCLRKIGGRSSRRSTISPRRNWCSGRVALVGDAASSARPHMGFGMAKAGGDAQALAEALRTRTISMPRSPAYNAERQPMGERIVLHGRKLGMFLGVNVKTEEDRRMSKLLSDHRGQMDWIAVPNFLGH